MSKEDKNYVNNKEFLQGMVDYKKAVREAEEQGKETPIIPDYVGKCILKIAHGIASRPNFSGYPFKEEMIEDGLENCFLYIGNFDPEKGTNAFGYFSRIIWFAFLRRIKREKKELYTKFKMIQRQDVSSDTYSLQGHDDTYYNEQIGNFGYSEEYMNEFIREFEVTMNKDKNKNVDEDTE